MYDHYIELNQMDSQMSISHGPSTHTTWCTRSHKISTAIKANSNLRMQQQVRIVTTKSFRLHFGRPKMLKLSHWVNLRTKICCFINDWALGMIQLMQILIISPHVFLSDIITYSSFGSVKPHSQSVSFLKHFGVASMKRALKRSAVANLLSTMHS